MSGPFDEVVEEVLAQLESAGFGVLCDVDLRTALEVDTDAVGEGRCRVIDTYNPSVARAATKDAIARRILLPGKVVVYENDGETVVAVADSGAVLSEEEDPDLEELAETVDQRLAQVLRSVTMETDVIEE